MPVVEAIETIPISVASERDLRRIVFADLDPTFWGMIASRPALVDGHLLLPEAPGFGWQLDEDFIEKYRV